MEIKLLSPGYKDNSDFYKAFKKNRLAEEGVISEETLWLPHEIPEFPIYLGLIDHDEREKLFKEMIHVIRDHVIDMERDIYMDERFWHSWLCIYRRDYLVRTYPQVLESEKDFRNIIIKKFDWENYIYKAILMAQYVTDFVPKDKQENMYTIILNNVDMYNYIIKYEIFRNGQFLIKIMEIIEEENLSKILKAKIRNRPDLGKDERYGRRVIFELNKSYPIVLSPMLEKDELKKYFMRYLGYYYAGEEVLEEDDEL